MEGINRQNIIKCLDEIILSIERFNNKKKLSNENQIKKIRVDLEELKDFCRIMNLTIININQAIENKNHNKIADLLVQLSLNIDEHLWYLEQINNFITLQSKSTRAFTL